MYTLRQREQQRIEALANDLAENIVENENDAETSLTDTLKILLDDELARAAAGLEQDKSKGLEEVISSRSYQELQEAVRMAAVKCKHLQKSRAENESKASQSSTVSSNETSAAPKSFSLFDSPGMMGGFSLDAFVTADQLEEAQELDVAPDAKNNVLVLLEKVQHVDDLMHSWQDIVAPSISKGLKCQDAKHRYVKLCRKWFFEDLDNREMERLLARNDLCHAVSDALSLYTTHEAVSSEPDFALQMIQLWHDMWMTILPHYSRLPKREQGSSSMEHIVWLQFSHSTSALPLLLAMVDPYAKWFASWVHQMQPMQLAKLLRECQDFIPYLVEHGYASASLQATRLPPELAQQVNANAVLTEAIMVQSLCMLHSILIVTRVILFPWDLTVPQQQTESTSFTTSDPSLEQAQLVTSLFAEVLHVGISQPDLVPAELARVCGEGILVILKGCWRLEEFMEALFLIVTKRLLIVDSISKQDDTGESLSTNSIGLSQCKCAVLQICNEVLQSEIGTDAQRQGLINSLGAVLQSWSPSKPDQTLETAEDLRNVMEMLLYDHALVAI